MSEETEDAKGNRRIAFKKEGKVCGVRQVLRGSSEMVNPYGKRRRHPYLHWLRKITERKMIGSS